MGWIEDLSVGKLMRKDAPSVPQGATVADFRKRFPLGGPKRVFLTDITGRYAGIIATADAYNPDLDQKLDQPIDALAATADQFLLPEQNVRTALRRFSSSETETLAVVSDAKTLHVVGFLTEGYALRRYSQELERSRAEELGEHSLYGPA